MKGRQFITIDIPSYSEIEGEAGVSEIIDRLEGAGFEAYIVGGAARNLIIGRKIADWDITTSAPLDQVIQLFKKVVLTGFRYQTVTVVLFGRHYEVTAHGGRGGKIQGFLEEDLRHRDFTINAMAFHPGSKQIIDPYGGIKDMERGIIRAVEDPRERFREDPLRILRAFRFEVTMKYHIERETLRCIPDFLVPFRSVSKERVRDELLKILEAERPSKAFEGMRTSGLLSVVIPELLEGYRKKQTTLYHAYDIYRHSLETMDRLDARPLLRLAGLLHDIGKPSVRKKVHGVFRFLGHEALSSEMADQIMTRLRFSNAQRLYVTRLVGNHMVDPAAIQSDRAIRRFLCRVGPENVEDLLALRRADLLARGDVEEDLSSLEALQERIAEMKQKELPLKVADLALKGTDVMRLLKIGPGPKVGEVLDRLLEVIIEEPRKNNLEDLTKAVLDMGLWHH